MIGNKSFRTCPEELMETVHSLIYAAPIVSQQIQELEKVSPISSTCLHTRCGSSFCWKWEKSVWWIFPSTAVLMLIQWWRSPFYQRITLCSYDKNWPSNNLIGSLSTKSWLTLLVQSICLRWVYQLFHAVIVSKECIWWAGFSSTKLRRWWKFWSDTTSTISATVTLLTKHNLLATS